MLVTWLSENESALSAVAALTIIAGLFYGALRFILAPFLRVLTEKSEVDQGVVTQPAPPMPAPDEPRGEVQIRADGDKPSPIIESLHNSEVSIAVLLFEPLSENKDDEYMASGITSEVIAHVTMVPHIRVSSRLASFGYRSGHADIQAIADQLNTRFILTGSLRRSGDRIMVIAQLTDTKNQSEIWAQTYDRQVKDIFDVQHDIAKCIVGAVLGEVKLAETTIAGSVPAHQLDAWGLVQKAYHFWLTSFTPEGLMQACEYLQQAIDLDPNYSSARAALAMLLTQQINSRICADYDSALSDARTLIETAYQQSPNDIDVLENAGVVWQNLGDAHRANLALRRVIEMAPLNLIARGYLALLLGLTGSEDEAREAQQLIDENFATAPKHPSAPYWNFFAAIADQRLGQQELAIKLAKKSLIGQPGWVHNYFVIANGHCVLGDIDAAKIAIENALTINPFLTAQLYAENVYRICGADTAQAEAFTGGMKQYELVK